MASSAAGVDAQAVLLTVQPDSVQPAVPPEPTSAHVPESDDIPHLMRIAAQGKLRAYVAFALKYLQESHSRPLVLHTLAPTSPKPAVPFVPSDEPAAPVEPPPRPQSAKGLASCTSAIPRLISVVEIIKREFVELMSHKEGNEGWVLHQYNELGCLEEQQRAGPGNGAGGGGVEGGAGEKSGLSLLELLEGKNHLHIRRTPYMKITLTKERLKDHDPKTSTYQDPLPSKKRSKSAKARERKKRKKAGITGVTDPAAPSADVEMDEEVEDGAEDDNDQ